MKSMLLLLSALTFSSLAWGRLSDGKEHCELRGGKIICHADKGFHFNKEAPASLQVEGAVSSVSPLTKEENELVFDATLAGAKKITLNFYVCDDEKTACEEHNDDFKIEKDHLVAMAAGKSAGAAAAPATSMGAAKAGPVEISKNGFIENNYLAAVKKAKAEKKLILVDFSAPWCPACIRLETEVFGQKDFKKATSSVVKLALNVDLPQNKDLSDKFNIRAIPTLILMDTDANELYRSLDFKPSAALASELSHVLKHKPVGYAALKVDAEQGDAKAMAALGLRAYNALNYAEAVKWLAPLKDHRLLFAGSEVAYWSELSEKDAKNKKNYTDVLEKWITLMPDTYEAIVWRNEWAHQLTGEGKVPESGVRRVLEDNRARLQKNLANKKAIRALFKETYQGDFSGFEKIELQSQLADTDKTLGDSAAAQKTQNDIAADLKRLKLSTARPGELLVALHYLGEAGQTAQVGQWYEKLVKAYPHSYVYYMKLARFYTNQKEFAKALPMAQKAVELGPELKLNNMQQLARIQISLNQKNEARHTLDQALALPEAKWENNKKVADSLAEMKKSLK
jgi:thioredoxin-like negative regulator of GroEL